MVLLRPWGRRSRNSSKLRVLAEEVQEWVRLRRVLEEHLFVFTYDSKHYFCIEN
jgi:hypothetical protein